MPITGEILKILSRLITDHAVFCRIRGIFKITILNLQGSLCCLDLFPCPSLIHGSHAEDFHVGSLRSQYSPYLYIGWHAISFYSKAKTRRWTCLLGNDCITVKRANCTNDFVNIHRVLHDVQPYIYLNFTNVISYHVTWWVTVVLTVSGDSPFSAWLKTEG